MPVTVQTEARQGLSSRRALFLLSVAILLAMSLWFTGTAVIPQITTLWHSGLALGSWLTIAVQIGFSVGAITFALFNIPDVFSPIKVLVVSAVAAAAANAAFAFLAALPLPAILLRGATGFFLAGVYPVGMKIIAGWFQRGRGLALGIMIGALTVGSAVPHAVNAHRPCAMARRNTSGKRTGFTGRSDCCRSSPSRAIMPCRSRALIPHRFLRSFATGS